MMLVFCYRKYGYNNYEFYFSLSIYSFFYLWNSWSLMDALIVVNFIRLKKKKNKRKVFDRKGFALWKCLVNNFNIALGLNTCYLWTQNFAISLYLDVLFFGGPFCCSRLNGKTVLSLLGNDHSYRDHYNNLSVSNALSVNSEQSKIEFDSLEVEHVDDALADSKWILNYCVEDASHLNCRVSVNRILRHAYEPIIRVYFDDIEEFHRKQFFFFLCNLINTESS